MCKRLGKRESKEEEKRHATHIAKYLFPDY
jgi:hypothetical protein